MVGDYAGAIDLWARLVDAPEGVDPALASHALFQLARAHDLAGAPERALAAFERFAARHPTDALVRFNVGEILSRLGRLAEAEGAYLAAAELDADPAAQTRKDALVNLADDRAGAGNAAGALEVLREARGIDPSDADVRLALAAALRAVGDLGAAAAEAQRAVELLETPHADDDADDLRRADLARGVALVRDLEAERAGRNPAAP